MLSVWKPPTVGSLELGNLLTRPELLLPGQLLSTRSLQFQPAEQRREKTGQLRLQLKEQEGEQPDDSSAQAKLWQDLPFPCTTGTLQSYSFQASFESMFEQVSCS